MTTEQWVILALVILWPLLASVARLRLGPASRDNRAPDTVGVGVPARGPLPPPLPEPGSDAPASLARAVQNHRIFAQPSEAQRPDQTSVHDRRNAQWVRPMRNLRRAIIVTAILSPPNK